MLHDLLAQPDELISAENSWEKYSERFSWFIHSANCKCCSALLTLSPHCCRTRKVGQPVENLKANRTFRWLNHRLDGCTTHPMGPLWGATIAQGRLMDEALNVVFDVIERGNANSGEFHDSVAKLNVLSNFVCNVCFNDSLMKLLQNWYRDQRAPVRIRQCTCDWEWDAKLERRRLCQPRWCRMGRTNCDPNIGSAFRRTSEKLSWAVDWTLIKFVRIFQSGWALQIP